MGHAGEEVPLADTDARSLVAPRAEAGVFRRARERETLDGQVVPIVQAPIDAPEHRGALLQQVRAAARGDLGHRDPLEVVFDRGEIPQPSVVSRAARVDAWKDAF